MLDLYGEQFGQLSKIHDGKMLLFHRLSQDGLVIEDEMSLDAGIVSASFDASLEMVRDSQILNFQ